MADEQIQRETLLAEFCEESSELLQSLPSQLSDFRSGTIDNTVVHGLFRAVHTVKGNAGFFGLKTIQAFAHQLEDSLDKMRAGGVSIDHDLARMLIDAIDVLGGMITEVHDGAAEAEGAPEHDELLAKIRGRCERAVADEAESRLLREIRSLAQEMASAGLPQATDWSQKLQGLIDGAQGEREATSDSGNHEAAEEQNQATAAQLLQASFSCSGFDATDLARGVLEPFDRIQQGDFSEDHGRAVLAAAEELVQWLKSRSEAELAETIEACRGDFATIIDSPVEMDLFLVSAVWERLGPAFEKMKSAPGAADHSSADSAPESHASSPSASASEENPSQLPDPQADAEDHPTTHEKPRKDAAPAKSRLLRVREDRVDHFLEEVSRLFITGERLKDLYLRLSREFQTHELVDELRQINATLVSQSTALQRGVVELRKVPVRGLFSKFPRVARTLAAKLGKQLDIRLEGEDVEIDKSLLEDLDGPLTHMIRNVCDHGIEPAEERVAKGASPQGLLLLSCALTKTHVRITVQDDGRGIDPEKLKEKAVRKGVLSANEAAALSRQEATELIFHPGFSTAEEISEVSGRGVGLDVVRTRLREHDGDVTVESRVGKGTTFCLEIPIRKAVVVIDALLVRQHGTTFAIPFEGIQEIVRLDSGCETLTVRNQPVAQVRGEPYASVSLADLLDLRERPAGSQGCEQGVLLRTDEKALFLTVDAVVGQRKVVVSDLSSVLPCSDIIPGVAQLGGGKLALVLSVPDLLRSNALS